MVKNVGATNENRRNRINCILKHIIKYKESQKKLTEKRLLLLLARDGHKSHEPNWEKINNQSEKKIPLLQTWQSTAILRLWKMR